MAPRGKRWTILILPPNNESPRSFEVSNGQRQALIWAAGTIGAIVVAAAVFLFTPYSTPGTRLLMAENTRLKEQLEGIDVRLAALSDTLVEIAARDNQIRALASIPDDTSAIAAAEAYTGQQAPDRMLIASGPPATALPQAPARKPFLNRLGFGDSRSQIELLTERASKLAESFRSVSDTLTRNLERLANTPSIMPTTGWLSSHFSQGRLHPILHESRPHEGIDVSAPRNAPIIAPAMGRVRAVGWVGGYGNSFEIDHGNGIVTRYAHCTRIVVREGQTVSRGQLIATVGNTGLSIGPHLHYEVHVNGSPVDPLRYVLAEHIVDQQ